MDESRSPPASNVLLLPEALLEGTNGAANGLRPAGDRSPTETIGLSILSSEEETPAIGGDTELAVAHCCSDEGT